jgi:DNA polymerase sigma
VNNILAVHNTRLIEDYCKIDERVTPLIYIIKYWAKRRAVNEPYQGTLSSYAYILLIIHYLQTLDVLPILQDLSAFPKEGMFTVSHSFE